MSIRGSPSWPVYFPLQKRLAHETTPRHWSGFFSNFEAANAQFVRNGTAFSSPKQLICSKVAIISVMAANCDFESDISSSYNENA